ncbi:MAG TPA: hypothetical protein VM791_19965 [Vicinamibacterales bacterium]|nr:hypothetical protein [Vicinamibacterales bacterium]
MDPTLVHAYVSRDWAQGEAAERSHWADIYRRDGSRALWSAAQGLFVYMRAIRPEFPDDGMRTEDLAHHVRVKDHLDRAAHAFTRR